MSAGEIMEITGYALVADIPRRVSMVNKNVYGVVMRRDDE